MSKRKIALVGIGKIARDQHIPAIANSKDWELAATVSRNASVDGVESFSDVDSMLNTRPEIEVVSFCTPPAPRFDAAMKALIADRHVMLEKPPGATLSECYVLEAEAKKRNRTLFATWHSREASSVDAARDWLAEKDISKFQIVWKESVRVWHPGQTWIWEPGGLGVFDPGINALSIMTKILPSQVHVKSADLWFPENCQTPIAANIAFAHPGEADVGAEFDFRQEGEQIWSIFVETTDGQKLTLTDGGATLTINGEQIGFDDADLSLHSEYPRLYRRMAELVPSALLDTDFAPLAHVADAFLLGNRIQVEPFIE